MNDEQIERAEMAVFGFEHEPPPDDRSRKAEREKARFLAGEDPRFGGLGEPS